MRNVVLALTLASSALLSTAVSAAPLAVNPAVTPDTGIEQVRMVCDDLGRCYRTRGGARVIVREGYDSYNYAPRERYIERRGYYDGGYYAPGPSIGIGVGPVGVGVDVGPRW